MKNQKVVVSLGGNAIQSGNKASDKEQRQACYHTAQQLVHLFHNDYEVVITHGNGPQVGNIMLQQQLNENEQLPAMPLDTCGAMSQGMIGYWMQNALLDVFKQEDIEKDVSTIITQVLVDTNDQAFTHLTKPIGPFYNEQEANILKNTKGYIVKEDAGRGFRRVVASPKPLDIVEKNVIETLVEKKYVVIAGGGGGIPVINKNGILVGVEAVIDKDFVSEKIAELIDADILLILTTVDHVSINYNTQNQIDLHHLTVEEAHQYIEQGQFAEGSMLPKVQAALQFVNSKPGRKAIITSLDHVVEAFEGNIGTQITQAEKKAMFC
ncbi:carbamate kinase [Cytobacillus sp. IB215665]|uniref:carbamate kinase n=1 Tax=Cytobacillus sp. IB215665 TaxID=3097357 RepID=UPI002A11B596|nr:carbamate kinase [Cytobacillus sp. IB215665]MDX8363913.1 carbamate kinase [Cytobacillus sp. IB215665]